MLESCVQVQFLYFLEQKTSQREVGLNERCGCLGVRILRQEPVQKTIMKL